ncbi:ABC transporter [Labrys neptuniae]|uniref:ABC transporter n=2 Tax=Labrys neptuniae TaxID=376174 RepID=A0ABV3PIS4_9HYPH|nr:ABC transporter [Labrys neptuniae]MDT3376751.1 ABC transporter [Labrys neptuniae]
MDLTHTSSTTVMAAFERQRRVISAVMLRNVRTRFFGHGLGYIVAVGWPISHILLLIAIFSITGRAAPYGESVILFIATGTVPFMVFSYLSRFMMVNLVSTRPLLSLPGVRMLDVLIAGAILEILSSAFVIIFMIILGITFDVPILPQDITTAFCALGASILLGCGMGVINSVIVAAVPMWMTGYSLLIIGVWASSGVVFVADTIPEPYRSMLAYNPALQTVEWMRSAYYTGYGQLVLDKPYTIAVGLVSLVGGLALERVLRNYVLSTR